MIDTACRMRAAKSKAGYIVRRFGVSSARDIRLDRIAYCHGARIVTAPLDGAAGQLARRRDRTTIVLPESVSDPIARKQTIAHELGHLVLEHPSMPPHELCSARKVDRNNMGDVPDYEAEADAFGDAALMPEHLIRRRCEVSPVSLAIPRALAEEFEVPLLRAALRFVDLASERCALVRSTGQTVREVWRSATFTRELEVGVDLEPTSVAWDQFANGTLDDQAQPVPASAWMSTRKNDTEVIEHSTVLPDPYGVLSLLWVPEAAGASLGMP